MAAMINQTASFRVLSCNTRPSKTLQKGSVCWVESVMGKLLLYHSHQTYCNNAFLRNICSPRKERKMKPREEEVSRAVLVQAQAQQKNAEKDDWAASSRSSGRCPPRGRDTAGKERARRAAAQRGQAVPSCLSDRGYSHWDASWHGWP